MLILLSTVEATHPPDHTDKRARVRLSVIVIL